MKRTPDVRRSNGRCAGYDFVDDKQDPKDPLNYKFPLKHPGHGIGTGSVILVKVR